MAEPDVQREGENEARLRMERLASSRASQGDVSEKLQRWSGASWQPPPPVASATDAGGDRAVSGIARQQRLETQLNMRKRQEQKPGGGGGGGGISAKQAMSLAKATPAGAVAGVALQGLAGGGLSKSEIRKTIGRGCVKSLWQSLWPTFGHTIYFISLLFFLAWGSRFARRYLPELGEEWIPPSILAIIPKEALIPLKLAELLAILFILFWVLLLDLVCIGFWAFIFAIIMSAVNFT